MSHYKGHYCEKNWIWFLLPFFPFEELKWLGKIYKMKISLPVAIKNMFSLTKCNKECLARSHLTFLQVIFGEKVGRCTVEEMCWWISADIVRKHGILFSMEREDARGGSWWSMLNFIALQNIHRLTKKQTYL